MDMCRNCGHLKRLEIFDCQMVSRSAIHKLEVCMYTSMEYSGVHISYDSGAPCDYI